MGRYQTIIYPPNDSKGYDYPTWNLDTDGKFIVGSVKKAITNLDQRNETNIIADIFLQLWKSKISKKGWFLSWSLSHNCINTSDVLQRKIHSLKLNPNWCSLCNKRLNTSLFLAKSLRYFGLNLKVFSVGGSIIKVWNLSIMIFVLSINTTKGNHQIQHYCFCVQHGWREITVFSSKRKNQSLIFGKASMRYRDFGLANLCFLQTTLHHLLLLT